MVFSSRRIRSDSRNERTGLWKEETREWGGFEESYGSNDENAIRIGRRKRKIKKESSIV